ncbi:uncharacterized protein [Macrobrachium rosenbergii]|uniref:uncharacterized protein n=1 Tax=Macrobrachium rosenbergii TaxID=79674 RepID=UPI0034D7172D
MQSVPSSKLKSDDGRVWYMLHHSVLHPTKQKIQVVFNLKIQEQPARCHGQYREMFHQVKVPVQDRDLHFFWLPKNDTMQDWIVYEMGVYVFGMRSSPSCMNYTLRPTAEEHGHKYSEQASQVRRLLPRKHNNASGDCLSVEELTAAESIIWRPTQREAFPREVAACSQEIKRKILMASKIVKLKPIIHESLLHVGSCLQHAPCNKNIANPIILPKTSLAVHLLVRWQHERLGHCGQNFLLADLRQRFWIVQANAVAHSVVRSCLKCRAICACPIIQEMADLPQDQLFPGELAFPKSATNCFRPFLVKIGKSESIRSNNGTKFVGADATLHDELKKLNQTTINDALTMKGTSWQYNRPVARRVIKGICHQQVLTDDSLNTLFCEVEAIVNSRPLVCVTDNANCLLPLTPNMLLNLKGSPGPITSTACTVQYSRLCWRQVQHLSDLFWRCWTREYLPPLREHQRWTTRRQDLQNGDVVLALDEKGPRGTWPLVRVIEVIRSADGSVLSARLKTDTREYLRPVSKMCILLKGELSASEA